jgi:diaminopimelate decarboxylase
VYTADILSEAAIDRIVQTGVALNVGSEDMLTQLGSRSRGRKIWLRVNPGFGHGHSQKVNTGGVSSKHGIWHDHLQAALARVDQFGLDLVGLHMHIGSGSDLHHLQQVCDAMAAEIERLGRDVRAVSGGGGLPVPYRAGDAELDVDAHFQCWDRARKRIEAKLGHAVELEIEPGRFLVAQAGLLLSEVRATKHVGENHFTLVDAGFNDLVRPAMYGAYHEISVIAQGATSPRPLRPTVVAGPLCESGDVFTQDGGGNVIPRNLPEAKVGDLLVFHDAGAYGASMASNYNSRPLVPEVLIDGTDVQLIRRRQTLDELIALEEM